MNKVATMPISHIFDFASVPTDKFAAALDDLFHQEVFINDLVKRNRLCKTMARLRPNTSEANSVIKNINNEDRRLSDTIYAALIQACVNSEEVIAHVSFNHLLKYDVDHSREGVEERIDHLAGNLDKVVFMADMLESIITDIKADMKGIFGSNYHFKQFDVVNNMLKQLSTFFGKVRSDDANTPEGELYMDYADSINSYLDKRLKTYTDKYRKLNPLPKVYTAEQMLALASDYFGISSLPDTCIARTNAGSPFLNVSAISQCLDSKGLAKLNKIINIKKLDASNVDRASFTFTDFITSRSKT